MGTDHPLLPADGEGPARRVEVAPFRIAPFAVTNRDFATFVDETGYRTDAERFGSSFVFAGLLPAEFPPTRAVAAAPWWRVVEGAYWRAPEGPATDLAARSDHPVVHLSWNDASAYAEWAGLRLPSEAEWEYAARGGLEGRLFPWGDELEHGGRHHCNVWQGEFPHRDSGADGYVGTAPVDAFEPNGFGLYDVCGNVWEWCVDAFHVPHDGVRARDAGADAPRTLKGGSYLCHRSYCTRYRLAARTGNTPDSSLGNTGFRLAGDA